MKPVPRPTLLLLIAALLTAASARGEYAYEQAPDFAMTDLGGQEQRLSDYRGRWVVLNYWATWCPPCIEEMPELVAFQAANPQYVVLGINVEDVELQVVKDFAAVYGINYPVLPTGPNGPTFTQLRGLPTTQIVDPAGRLLADHVGPVTREMLEDFIVEETLAAQGAAKVD